MKLTSILILSACLHVAANGISQTVSLSFRDAPIEKVFKAIRQQTHFTFFTSYELLQNAKKVTINVKDMPLKQVLELCFKDQPFTYVMSDNIITLVPKKSETPVIKQTSTLTDELKVHGKVVDENGKPVAGVTVTVKGTKKQTITDENGEFTIPGVEANAILAFSTVNMQPFEIRVDGKAEVLAKLKTKTSELDEVQIIAYGQTTQRLQTGNVTTIKGADIEKQPINNPLLALEGRVPGVFITQSSGMPASGVKLRIQGQNSIGSGNDPLYIIDGVPYNSQSLQTTYAPQLGGYGAASPFFYLNPNDIESIEILKDADVTAIYGSRAANGAILITTKKGKAGDARVSIDITKGWGKVTRKLDLLNTQQYLEMRHEAKSNDKASITATDYDINGVWDTTRYTDWQRTLIGGTAQYTNVTAGVAGGTVNSQYLVSCTYHRETTVFPGSSNDTKGSVHISLNNYSTNRKFHFQLTGNYLRDNNRLPTVDLTANSIVYAPDAPNLYNSDGTLNWMPNSAGVSTWANPLANLNNNYISRTNNLISNAIVSYAVLPGLEVKSSFGYNSLQTDETMTYPLSALRPERRASSTRVATYTNSSINSWIIEPQITYDRLISKGKLSVLIGSTIQQNNSNGKNVSGSGYNSDAVLEDIRSATMITAFGSVASVYKYNALFGRVNYNLLNKYIVNINSRRDGSSRFGSKNQFHDFWSLGMAWLISQEKLIKETFPIISLLKIRGSYGTTGNDQIGEYSFMDLYTPVAVYNPYQNVAGLMINNLPNPYLQWEENKKLQIGVDFSVLSDRIFFTTNYVRNRSSNQLLSYALPSTTGFTYISDNFPATVQNTAWEFSLNTLNVKTKNFTWNTSLNLTIPENKLVAFPNLETSNYSSSLIIGKPITIVKAFHALGVDPNTGIYNFASKTDQFNPKYPDDATKSKSTLPQYYGGFENSFSFKGLQMDFLFQFVKQTGTSFLFNFLPGFVNYNQPVTVMNHWRKPSDVSEIQRLTQTTGSVAPGTALTIYRSSLIARQSDLFWDDASYIRLKNVSISWTVPKAYITRARIQNCKIYATGQNLITITKFKGMDPENNGANLSLPPLRMFVIGIQLGL